MRYLAIDFGDRRTGLALGDDETRLVSPLEVIECPAERLPDRIAVALETHAPDALVIGLPLNMDGTEGPRAKATRAFGSTLLARFVLPVHYQDERLTSFAADEILAGSGHTHAGKRRRRDAIAAAEILRDFLDEHHGRA